MLERLVRRRIWQAFLRSLPAGEADFLASRTHDATHLSSGRLEKSHAVCVGGIWGTSVQLSSPCSLADV